MKQTQPQGQQYGRYLSPYLDAAPVGRGQYATLPLRNVPCKDAVLNLYVGAVVNGSHGTILTRVVLENPTFHGEKASFGRSEQYAAVLRALILGKRPTEDANVSF